MLLYLPYTGWPLAMQMEKGDAVTPATPGAGTAAPNTMINMLGFSPMHNGDGYHLSFLVPQHAAGI